MHDALIAQIPGIKCADDRLSHILVGGAGGNLHRVGDALKVSSLWPFMKRCPGGYGELTLRRAAWAGNATWEISAEPCQVALLDLSSSFQRFTESTLCAVSKVGL